MTSEDELRARIADLADRWLCLDHGGEEAEMIRALLVPKETPMTLRNRVPSASMLAAILVTTGCTSFVDTTTPAGVPNLLQFAPKMYRMGQPPATEAAWRELARRIAPNGEPVVIVKLDDETEGNDDLATQLYGWEVARLAIPPEDDKPWTVFEPPDVKTVQTIVQTIVEARLDGKVVAWHCVHGRDRTGLVSALVGMRLFGWSKDAAWKDMLAHGFRWELPDLAAFWIADVKGTP